MQTGVEILAELGRRGRRSGRERPDDEQGIGGQGSEPGAHEVAEPAGDAVAHHGTADGLAHDESGARRGGLVCPVQMHN